MTLQEIFKSVDSQKVSETWCELYPEKETFANLIPQLITEILQTNVKTSTDYIGVVVNTVFDDDPFLEVFVSSPYSSEIKSMSSYDWRTLLGMSVDESSLLIHETFDVTKLMFVATCLYEMTFYGLPEEIKLNKEKEN